MASIRVYYVRISDDRQDFLRQVNGLKTLARERGDDIPEALWQAVLDKKPLPADSPVLWDWGSRDMAEQRGSFQRMLARVEGQKRSDPRRLQEVCIYELDRFGVEGPDEWFHYRYVFNKHGCRIFSVLKGDLTAKEDLRTIIETLFESITSRAEQKKIAGRTAGAMAGRARKGEYMGGVPRLGYDLGCFDQAGRLLWRLHYRDTQDRLQIVATADNQDALPVEGAQTVEYHGPNNHPQRANSQHYRLVPSCDGRRVDAVRWLFSTYRAQAPAISFSELARQMRALGYTSYRGRSFDPDNLLMLLQDDTFVGRRPYAKRSVARHKRFTTRGLEDVPEESKGQTVYNERTDWIFPDTRTHAAIIDDDTFAAVQKLLAARPKKGGGKGSYAPRGESGWMKPLLYCGCCGRQMICRPSHGRQGYVCVSYNYRYQRPGDERFRCEAGLNWIRHDDLERTTAEYLDTLEADAVRELEFGAIRRLEEEIARSEALAAEAATSGFRTYLRSIRDVFGPSGLPATANDLIERLLASQSPDEQLTGLEEVERLLPSLSRAEIGRIEEQHRLLTLAIARPDASPRQVDVWQGECKRLEERLGQLERLLVPYRQQADMLTRGLEEKVAQLAEAKQAVVSRGSREKAAALSRVADRLIVIPAKAKAPGRVLMLIAPGRWGCSGRVVLWPAGEGKPPLVVRDPALPTPDDLFVKGPAWVAETVVARALGPWGVDSLAAKGVCRALSFGVHGDPWAEQRFRARPGGDADAGRGDL